MKRGSVFGALSVPLLLFAPTGALAAIDSRNLSPDCNQLTNEANLFAAYWILMAGTGLFWYGYYCKNCRYLECTMNRTKEKAARTA